MVNILVICSANRFRSVIAAEYLRSLLIKNPATTGWQVSSAGTWAKNGLPPIPQALHYANSRGLEIKDVRSREVNREMLAAATLVLVMTESQREALSIEFPFIDKKVLLLAEACAGQTYDIPDPFEKDDQAGEAIGHEILALISGGFEQICDIATQLRTKHTVPHE